jgi:hypothetical protein
VAELSLVRRGRRATNGTCELPGWPSGSPSFSSPLQCFFLILCCMLQALISRVPDVACKCCKCYNLMLQKRGLDVAMLHMFQRMLQVCNMDVAFSTKYWTATDEDLPTVVSSLAPPPRALSSTGDLPINSDSPTVSEPPKRCSPVVCAVTRGYASATSGVEPLSVFLVSRSGRAFLP